MSILVSDQDIVKIRDAFSQIVKDTIGQVATVLVPAVAGAVGPINATITVSPITIGPLIIKLTTEDK